MSQLCVYERNLSNTSLPSEDEVVRLWKSLPAGSRLPLLHGGFCSLLFAGRPGGAAGPDVRDAVLLIEQGEQSSRQVGDVEFHVRASDWGTHQHSTDPRYNNVLLHVVLVCDDLEPTLRQDGKIVPVCSLNDLAPTLPTLPLHRETLWPCHNTMQNLSDDERFRLLRHAGRLRFEQKTHSFVEQLRAVCQGDVCAYDLCLIPALAEGLGYGRDRDFFRAAGLRLLGQTVSVPEPLGRSPAPSPLDVARLHVLQELVARWREVGIWYTLHNILCAFQDYEVSRTLQELRAFFWNAGLSLARADIILCNVVLPFASAVALLEQDRMLAERVREQYEAHPGLSSNRITRMMCTQLHLKAEPRGSCQQQGLHYIYQQTCREKHCGLCIMGRRVL